MADYKYSGSHKCRSHCGSICLSAGSSTGTLILSPVSQTLVENIGWRNSFRVLCALTLVGALCGLMFESRGISTTPAQRVRKSPLSRLVADLHLWKSRVYVIWVAGITLVMFGYYIPYVHLVGQKQRVSLGLWLWL